MYGGMEVEIQDSPTYSSRGSVPTLYTSVVIGKPWKTTRFGVETDTSGSEYVDSTIRVLSMGDQCHSRCGEDRRRFYAALRESEESA